jgi:hypothetical protein
MSFSDFFQLNEAKFRENVSASLSNQIQKIADLYFNYYSSSNRESFKNLLKQKKILKFSQNKHWSVYFDIIQTDYPAYFAPNVATVKVFDLETQENVNISVHCIYGDVVGDYASYVDQYHCINLFDENLKGLPLNTVKSKILHEVTHGFQQYKLMSSKYEQVASKDVEDLSPEEMDVYYTEPIEFDAHTNEMVFNIREKYKFLVDSIKKASQPETKQIFQNRLRLFFQQLKVFVFADPKSYFDLKELVLPDFLIPIEDFVKSLKKYPKLWQKLKNKVLNLYKELAIVYNKLPSGVRGLELLDPIPKLGVD